MPSPVVDFESSDGAWAVTRTLRFSTKGSNGGWWDNLATSISVSNDYSSTAVPRDRVPVTVPSAVPAASTASGKFSVGTPQVKAPAAAPQNRFSPVPSGVNIGYGITYYLPINQTFSTYAQLKPPSLKSIFMFRNLFAAPQTMLATGFHLPLISAASPTGHDVSLKFSGAVDQHFRPIMSFTINFTPARR